MKKRKIVSVLVVILLVSWGGFNFLKKGDKPGVGEEEANDFQVYENSRGKFRLMIPVGWKAEEATDEAKFVSRVIFRPTAESRRVGTMGEMSVTILAATSSASLSTGTEFDLWSTMAAQPATTAGMWKVKNDELGGKPAVRLAEIIPIAGERGLKFWSTTSWMHNNGLNYYVNMMGNGAGDFSEEPQLSWMLSKFELLD